MPHRLQDKVAIITGGGTGIGQAIARTFASEGAKVAICGRTEATLLATARSISDQGGEAISVTCDVSQASQVEKMVQDVVRKFGRLDILVNNAGVRASITTISDLTEEEWDRTFNVDAKGTWLCSKHAIPEMRKVGGGSILVISSISAHVGQPKQGGYNAAKAGQELLMKCMAIDFAADRIRVNSICPAWVATDMNRDQLARMKAQPDKAFPPGLTYGDLMALHPIGRLGTPHDIAWAAVYLASDESTWVTGSSLMVDGGYTCR